MRLKADIIPRESVADVHRVYLYERAWRTFEGGKANEGIAKCLCILRQDGRLAPD